ncbi:MAG: anti-sigma factor antagonist [Leptospiraceae bacterium]|nr:anti-sigma factor antagonist [Leptospiraceae bacterium]
MKFRLQLEYPEIPQSEVSLNHLLVQLETPPVSGSPDRRPLIVGLAIDKSKSMYGSKMEATIEAASALVNWLTRHDQLTIVAYDSQVEMVQPLTPLNDKFSVIQKLQNIRVGTSTNLSGGWLQALRAVDSAQHENAFKRVILLTDGMANTGVVSTPELVEIAQSHYDRKISTTTIGFGRDFSESLLREISQAGGGNFYFIDGPEQAHEVFFKEFGDIAALYGQGLEIRLQSSPGVSIKELINDVPHSLDDDGNLILRPGDLRSDDLRNIVIMLEIDGAVASQTQGPLVSAECSFYNMLEGSRMDRFEGDVIAEFKARPGSQFNKHVHLETLLAASSRSMFEASRIAGERDLSAARDVLMQMISRLKQSEELEPRVLGQMIRRLEDLEHNLEENLNLTRKQMMAGSVQRSIAIDEFAGARPGHDKIHQVVLSGQLDLYRCPELKTDIRARIEQGYRYVVFDLTDLSYIDSSGIGTLIQISNWMQKRGGMMVLANTQGSVDKVFQISKLDNFFTFKESITDAQSYLQDIIAQNAD